MKPKTPDLMTMRKLVFILLAVIIGITAQAKNKTILRPAFKSMTKDAILPVKVEQTKDATIVHFHLVCAANRNWSMDGAQLRVDGQTFACRQARIITHDGPVVLADEPFEFGKKIERDARKDSVILYFEPLPKDTKTFDYIEGENRNSWQIFGIRLDNKLYPSLLPPYQPREDDGKPLEPIALKYGDATVTITMHGDSIKGFATLRRSAGLPRMAREAVAEPRYLAAGNALALRLHSQAEGLLRADDRLYVFACPHRIL